MPPPDKEPFPWRGIALVAIAVALIGLAVLFRDLDLGLRKPLGQEALPKTLNDGSSGSPTRALLPDVLRGIYGVGLLVGLCVAFVCWVFGKPVRRFRPKA